MSANYFKPGEHNVVCDRTGFKIKSGDSVKEWNGLRVRKQSAEPRHPQDKLKAVSDNQTVRDARPRAEHRYVGVNEVTAADL
jgi:hypothetical protein